jgi:hypothetical protein
VLDYLGRFEEAEASIRTALRLQPQDAFAHFKQPRNSPAARRAASAPTLSCKRFPDRA